LDTYGKQKTNIYSCFCAYITYTDVVYNTLLYNLLDKNMKALSIKALMITALALFGFGLATITPVAAQG